VQTGGMSDDPLSDDLSDDLRDDHGDDWVEVARLQPIEARVVAARLRASGIHVLLGPDSPYESLTVTEGMPILVPTKDAALAKELMQDGAESP
jgi:hypothetical protein